MVFEMLRCRSGRAGEPREARIGTRGGANHPTMPDWRIGRGQISGRKRQGASKRRAFVRRIASAFTRSRRRPAFRALSLKKKGSGQIGSPSTRSITAPCAGTVKRSEEHTSELQSLMRISYAVFCLKKKKTTKTTTQASI